MPSSVIGAVAGTAINGIIGGNAVNDAADTQANAANSATKLQKQIYEQNRADSMPAIQAGQQSVNQLGYLMGLNPTTIEGQQGNSYSNVNKGVGAFGSLSKPFGMDDYQADPGYAFRLAEGQKALERSQAAKGGLLSGAAGKAMANYSQGLASQEYQSAYDRYNTNQTNLYNRLAGVSGTGQTANAQAANAGTNYANNAGNIGLNNANSQSAAGIANANMWTTGLTSISNSLFNPNTGYYK